MTNEHPESAERRGRNIFAAIFVCMAAGLILAGILYHRNFEAQYRAEAGRGLSSVAWLKAEEVDHYRRLQLEHAAIFVDNTAFYDLLRNYLADRRDKNLESQLREWLAHISSSGSYDQVRILGARGAALLSFPASIPPLDPAVVRQAVESVRSGRAEFTDFYREANDNTIHLAVIAPITNVKGKSQTLGVLVFRADPSKYLYPVLQRWPVPSRTAETLLVRRDGGDALFLTPLRFRNDAPLKLRIPLSRAEVPAVRAVLGRTGVAEGIDYHGVPVLADTRLIPDSPWSMVTRIDLSEVTAQLQERLWKTILFTALLLTGAGIALALVWKQRSVGFYKERYAAAVELKESEENLRKAQEIAKLGSWAYNLSGRISWSDELYRVYGVSPETFTPTVESLLGLIHPEDRPAMAEWLRACGAGEKPGELVFRAVSPDGSVRIISGCGELVRGPDGKPAYMAGTAQDITERRKAEEELHENSEKINLLLNSAAEAIYGLDKDGNCTFCNSACLRLLGYKSQEELIGRNMHWQIHSKRPDGAPFPIEDCRIFQAFLKGKEERVDDEVLWRSDGTSFPAEYWSYPLLRDGAVVGAVVSFLDITERRKAGDALAESEKRFKALFSGARDAIFVIGITKDGLPGSFVEVNDIACERLGYTREELLKMSPKDIDSPESAAKIAELTRRLSEKGHVVFDAVHRARDGSLIPVEISSQQMELGGRPVLMSIARDVTGRRKAEEELRKLSLAVTESPSSVVITDAEGSIEYVNRRFTEVTGYSFEEARGANPRILKSGAQSPEGYRQFWRAISSGETWRGEFHNKRKNGELYWEAVSVSPLRNSENVITHYVAVKEDITARKRLEAELRRAKEEAETANRAKSTFLANMSHEIRTPMNAILGFSQLMRRDPAATPEQRQQLETINRSGEHLLALINDILEMSKAEAGRTTLNQSVFDLHTMAGDLEKMLRPRAAAKVLRLETELAAGLPRLVMGDEGKLRQILLNLLGNALKFTEKGTVIMRLGAQPGAGPGFRLRAEVEDTGPGIDPRDLGALFRPFEQTQAGRAAGTGTGLGLAISREYAHLMGGEVKVRSLPGQGSVFSLEIDLKEARQQAAVLKPRPLPQKRPKPGQPQCRVLVADDNEDNRELLARMLGPIGFEVRLAANGAQALAEFQSWRPQLILMDLKMPVMDGYEAIRRIRACAGGGETKILIVTASVFGEASRNVKGTGADDLLLKPFRDLELFEKIRSLLGAEYVCGEEAPAPPSGPADTGTLKPASAAGLPRELLSRLREAVKNGDFDLVAELAGEAEAHNTGLAGTLRGLAGEFDLRGILALLAKETPHDG